MKGKDIRCPKCGEGAVDVAPEFDFLEAADDGIACDATSYLVSCGQKHKTFVLVHKDYYGKPVEVTLHLGHQP